MLHALCSFQNMGKSLKILIVEDSEDDCLILLRDTSNQRRYVLPSRISEDARKLYTTLGLKPDTTPYEIPQN